MSLLHRSIDPMPVEHHPAGRAALIWVNRALCFQDEIG